MIENQKIRPAQVIGPLGEPLTVASLPSPSTKRWVVRRKAEVVAAVNGGLLTIDEVLERYNLTLEEFAGWQRAVDRSGMQGPPRHPHPALPRPLRAPAQVLSAARTLRARTRPPTAAPVPPRGTVAGEGTHRRTPRWGLVRT